MARNLRAYEPGQPPVRLLLARRFGTCVVQLGLERRGWLRRADSAEFSDDGGELGVTCGELRPRSPLCRLQVSHRL